MNFYGLKKVTLIDYPGKIACTVFTHGCNLRCPFCHNPELVIEKPDPTQTLSEEELLEFLQKRVNHLDGIVFTGGEPLLHHKKIKSLINKAKDLGYQVKIDTNGTFPQELTELIQEHLVDFVAMDFKTTPEKYPVLNATKTHIASILETLELLTTGVIPYEIRTTLVPGLHNIKVLEEIMTYVKKANSYVLQNFMPNGTINPSYKDKKSFSPEQMETFLVIASRNNPNTILRDQAS